MATRIVFCITELDPGGAEQALVQVVTRLQRADWEPIVFCLQARGRLAEPLIRAGIPVEAFGLRNVFQLPGVMVRLTRRLRQLRPVVLQTWLYHANLIGRVAGALAGVPHIVSGIRVAERRSRWRLRLDRWTSPLVEKHVCVSAAVAEFSVRVGGLPETRLVSIPNGVDFRRFQEAGPADLAALGISPQSPTVLFAGRLDRQKRPDIFIAAAELVLQVVPETRFLIAGDGPLHQEIEREIRARSLGGRIHLLGRSDEIPALLKRSRVLVLTSDWEGMPNVVLEAMAAGTPVVATDVEGVQELVTSGESGILIPRNDPRAAADAILRLIRHPEMAEKFGHMSQVMISQSFTWDSVAERYALLYQSLLLRGTPSSPIL